MQQQFGTDQDYTVLSIGNGKFTVSSRTRTATGHIVDPNGYGRGIPSCSCEWGRYRMERAESQGVPVSQIKPCHHISKVCNY